LQFDTVLFEPQALHFPCGVAGLDRAVLGSDCFPIGVPKPARVLVEDTPITEAEWRAIFGETATRIFRINCRCVGDR